MLRLDCHECFFMTLKFLFGDTVLNTASLSIGQLRKACLIVIFDYHCHSPIYFSFNQTISHNPEMSELGPGYYHYYANNSPLSR